MQTDSPGAVQAPSPTPTVKRRLISLVYEAFLLLAVDMLAEALFMVVTGNRQQPVYQHGLRFFLFLVNAAYFVHFWTDSGHTLAMKTWRMKVVMPGYARMPFRIAAVRYVLAWGWFMPALLAYGAFGVRSYSGMGAALVAGIVLWALTAFLDKDRQFLHDKLAGTRIVALPKRLKS